MSGPIVNKTIRIRRDTASNWLTKNPVLKLGEPGLETDTRKIKFGDGLTNWENLLYSGISSSSDIGDITFSGIKIIGNGEASGDGNGYSTIELVPDNSLYNNNQYLIVDPTAPNHIHLRAGGTQDASNADLIIGGEKNHIKISDQYSLARIQTESLITLDTYYLTSPEFSGAIWETIDGNHRITINDPSQNTYNAVWALSSSGYSLFNVIDEESNYYELTSNGSYTPGGSSPIVVYVNQAPPISPTTLTQLTFEIKENRQTSLEASGNNIRIEAANDIGMYSRNTFKLYNYSANDPIEIFTDYSDAEYRWAFRTDGILELSTGGIQFDDGSIQNTAVFKEDIDSLQTAIGLKLNSSEVNTDLIGGPGISLLYNTPNNTLSIYSNNEHYITALGTLTGSHPINYDPSSRSIQTLTLNGTSVTFTKGAGWPSNPNTSVDTILRITVSSATTITWTIVNDWFNQPSAGALAVGTHLFLLRAIGSSIIEGHYIGNKTN